jgi:nicotinamide phosphoribosyltransferase
MREKMSVSEFVEGTPVVPRLLRADAYTIGTGPHASQDAKERSIYHMVPRRGLSKIMPKGVALDDRIVFFGLRRIIRDLLTQPITMYEIEEADRFLATFHAGGTPYQFDRDMWVRVVEECDGIIPIRIEAFLDGSVVFPYEPVMQVSAQDGFGELAGWFESKFVQIWAPMERVTAAMWWRDYLARRCREIHPSWPEENVQFAISIMCHDFGDRAGACEMESEVLGMAHNMVFPGTDTVAGSYLDWKDTQTSFGCSIHALAHRTVTGFQSEPKCHSALYELGKTTGITAHVSDTNDFFKMVSKLGDRLANEWSEDSNVIVARPDSGDPLTCIKHVLDVCESNNLFEESDGFKCATRLRWIEGDGMDWETMINIINYCIRRGWSPFASGAFGVGGHLRNSIKRDHIGLSYKLAEVGTEGRGTCKRSETLAKTSIPGEVQVIENANENDETVWPVAITNNISESRFLLKPWYDGISGQDMDEVILDPCLETNLVARQRILNNFRDREQPKEVLSKKIRDQRDEVLNLQADMLDGDW